MKISKYTTFLNEEDNCTVIYNCANEALAVIETELAERAQSMTLAELKEKHAEFYAFLEREGYIVPDDTDEAERVMARWREEDTDPRAFNIFINPTLDCNLHCWYCYEKHVKQSVLSPQVRQSVLALARRKVAEGLQQLALSFFGGEPLLAYEAVVRPMLDEIGALCREHGVRLYVSFVTNGTLLTPEMVEQLKQVPTAGPVSFQIALDGNEYFHNKTKAFSKSEGSYRLILDHVGLLLRNGLPVTLRLNMTEENIHSYYEVLEDLEPLAAEQKALLTVDLQRVWQDSKNCHFDFTAEQNKVREAFVAEGFRVNELKHIDPSRCYADHENHVTVNYDGSLFKCTARDFTPANSEGQLSADGTITWNDKYAHRMAIKYGNAVCRQCRIFPLCHGGCSQYKLDRGDVQQCLRGYDDLAIEKVVQDRIHFLLERIINSKNNDL